MTGPLSVSILIVACTPDTNLHIPALGRLKQSRLLRNPLLLLTAEPPLDFSDFPYSRSTNYYGHTCEYIRLLFFITIIRYPTVTCERNRQRSFGETFCSVKCSSLPSLRHCVVTCQYSSLLAIVLGRALRTSSPIFDTSLANFFAYIFLSPSSIQTKFWQRQTPSLKCVISRGIRNT